ncbi:MAG: diaminopimelate decarboxylase [Phycisphaerales bacterium]|nr:MAG: diaminopimelate decarboxylase [Phycisphaerales bacterium]
MDFFNYRKGNLFAEDVDIAQIAADVDTPAYIYSKATFTDHLAKIQKAYEALDTTVCFSVKACGNVNILKFMAEAGSGFDIVSGGELYRVLQAGGDPSQVVYAGVGKTDQEITEALEAGIGYFNIESEQELETLIRLAGQATAGRGAKAKVALRVNPDVKYKTHAFLTTGVKETKFGVDIERALNVFETYGDNSAVDLSALHVHLGTGGKTIDPYVEAVEKILVLVDRLREKGHRIEALDLGGGYGADYETDTVPSAAEYAAGIVPLLQNKDLKLILEPGKSICANAGILLTRVVYVKQGGSKSFVIVDAGMNDLIRPSLYDAFHFIWPTKVESRFVPAVRSKELHIEGSNVVDIVGPICEGADFLAKDRPIPGVERGDLLAVFSAGAYGFTMSSNYNSRCRVPEVLVDGEHFQVIRRRETYEDLTALER